MAVSTRVLDDVIEEIRRNNEYQARQQNYVSGIVEETGHSAPTVMKAVDWLEKHGLARREEVSVEAGRPRKIITLEMDSFSRQPKKPDEVPDVVTELAGWLQ